MILAANWKMHIGPAQARTFLRRFLELVAVRPARRFVFFPPAVSVEAVADLLRDREDAVAGVQDVYWEPAGAFTGAISALLAREAGAQAALVGHSERRHVFGESDDATRRKVRAALEQGLEPFLCVGELLAEREAGETNAVVTRQLLAAVEGLDAAQISRLVVAYEPVWAIGTGRTATPDDAAEVHGWIHSTLEGLGAPDVPVLYGGSVKPQNAAALVAAPGVEGLLVGGASLDPESWAAVTEAVGPR